MLNDKERAALGQIRHCRTQQQAERMLHDLLEDARLGHRPPWTPFRRATTVIQNGKEIDFSEYMIFVNSRYQVTIFNRGWEEPFG